MILSKIDESVEIRGRKYDLYTNVGKEYISKGFEYQQEFEKEIVPTFKYKIGTTQITKTICMDYGKTQWECITKLKQVEQKRN